MSSKPFSVVDFTVDNSVEVVPTEWITEQGTKCFFPNPVPSKFYSLQINPDSKPGDDWEVYDVTVVGSSGTYVRGVAKAKAHIKNKTLVSTDDDLQARKRRNKDPQDPVCTINAPVLPLGCATINKFDVSGDTVKDNNVASGSVAGSSEVDDSAEHVRTAEVQVIQLTYDERLETLITEFRNFQEESLRNQNLLIDRIIQLERIILQSKAQPDTAGCAYGWKWPVTEVSQLDELEVWLEDTTNYQQEVSRLSRVGGQTTTKAVYNTLHWMISEEVALQVRFTEKSGKRSFGNSLAAKLLVESVKAVKVDATDSQLHKHVAAWFRQSSEREKSRKKSIACLPKNKETSSGETSAGSSQENSSTPTASAHSNIE